MNIDKFLGGSTCAKCGAPKIGRPDGGILCGECERKATEEFATKIRPDLGKKGKVELQWKPRTDAPEEDDGSPLIYED